MFTVFIPTLMFTAVVEIFMLLAWRSARNYRAVTAFCGFAVLVHLGWLCVPHLGGFAAVARWLAILWIGSMLTGMVLLIPFGLLTVLLSRLKVRRHVLWLPVIYAACFLISGIVLAITSSAAFGVRQEDIFIANLPAGLDGFRIANLGDVHIGTFIDAKELRHGIDALNEQHIDLIAITGDLIDDVSQLEDTMQVVEQSNAPFKTVAILGNHEEMGDLGKILAAYHRHEARISLLVNQNIAINRGGADLHIVGVDYPTDPASHRKLPLAEQNAAMSLQADVAFRGLRSGEMVVALSHHPGFFPFAAAHGAQLTLASHTHGGQLRLFGRPAIDVYPYLQGLYRDGSSYLEVSAGFGHWLPIRFGVPREIVIVTLRREV